LALHSLTTLNHNSLAATLFDGENPDTAKTKFFSSLELRGIK
jgi:hypothetical protein